MIDNLLQYQKEDYNLKQIEIKLSNSEERKKASSAKKIIEGYSETVKILEVKAANLVAESEKAKAEQEKLIALSSELTNSIETIGDEGEASFLVKKADELIAKIKNVSARINDLANEMQKVIAEFASQKKAVKEAQATYNEYAPKYAELKKSVQEDKSQIEAKLEAIKKTVDPALMERYAKKRAGKMYPVLFGVETNSNVCGACNMGLPMAELNKLKNGEVIECEHCGRLLYQK